MRLHAGLVLTVALAAASVAHAESAGSKLPFVVIRVMPDTDQVLVYDRVHRTHALVQPGSSIDDYRVVAVDLYDMVVESDHTRVVVYPPEAEKIATASLIDPPRDERAPIDPYAGPAPIDVRDLRAPIDPYATPTRRSREPAPR
jgi:hypothetical protein